MAALTPGCRNGAGPVLGLLTQAPDTPPDILTPDTTPAALARPAWVVAEPVPDIRGPANISDMKNQVVEYLRAIALIQRGILGIEHNLAALDPAAVAAVQVVGYTDPPERVDAAQAAYEANPPQQ